jgi:hypothetical protein
MKRFAFLDKADSNGFKTERSAIHGFLMNFSEPRKAAIPYPYVWAPRMLACICDNGFR